MDWARAVSAWSLIFAAPHFYWTMGGRRGLGAQAVVADEALSQGWFFAYNLLTGVAAVAAAVGVEVLSRAGRRGAVRFLQLAASAGCVILTLRGVVGIAALGLELGEGGVDAPAILVAIEFWFLLGGVLFGMLALRAKHAATGSQDGPG